MSGASAGRRLAALLAPVVEQAGLDLEDVEVTPAGKRRQVRVLIDKDGGVSLDDVALASQTISAVLDEDPQVDEVLGSAAYVLEVSSPGVDRPLVEPRHWRRAVGRLVRVAVTGEGELTGRVVEVGPDGVQLLPVDEAARPGRAGHAAVDVRAFGFDQLGPGRVQVEFNRPGGAQSDPGADDRETTDGDAPSEDPRFDETEESR